MSTSDDSNDLAQRQLLVEHRKRFQDAWSAGQMPSIEAHLDQVPELVRPLVLRELIAVEIEWRRKRGEQPEPSEYHHRFPGQARLVDEAFAGGCSVRCPADGEGLPPRRSGRDTACDLLFGILALQNSFIDRAALLSAFNVWTEDRTNSLGRILLDQGKLDSSRHALLTALVAEHLKLHGDDPDRSLAALSSLGPVRRDLENLADAELAVSLGHVGASHSIEPDPYATQTYVGEPTSGGVRFHILRPHARGGLGEVFAAFDDELHREVALKCIQDHHADDPSSRARFVQEAEITGGLEHPGIVPVYGLGHYNNGRPFYAMRLVKGDSLRTAIKQFHEADQDTNRDPGERSVSLRRLLGRFLDVCNAIAYAHSRGVLHRDLKPGNILLGKYGETLIIDWGLAKVVGRADPKSPDAEPTLRPLSGSTFESTRAGAAIGTPGYMSPEQARGDIDKLGPASDVFSLGATLYHLLTGHPAFEGHDFAERLQRNERCEFAAPRVVKPSVPRPLEAICLKAMATQQVDRYVSPRALGEDIEHWLADEPISALPESRSQKAARWSRRHRASTRAAVGALVVISAVSITSALLINQARRSERTALSNANTALAAETKAKAESEKQRKRAEDREQLAIDAVKKFRDAVVKNPELNNRENLKALRDTLLNEPLNFFRSLRDQLESSLDTRPDNLSRLGLASFELGATTESNGRSLDALQAFEVSRAIQEKLVQENPNVDEYQRHLGRTLERIGSWHRASGQLDDASRSYGKALEVLERLVAKDPNGTESQRDLARTYAAFAWLYFYHADQPADFGHELVRKAAAIAERLPTDQQTDAEIHSQLDYARRQLGRLHLTTGKLDEALESFRGSLEWSLKLGTGAEPSDLLAKICNKLAHVQLVKGQRNEAFTFFRNAVDITESALRENPTFGNRQTLADSYESIGNVFGPGQASSRRESFQKALVIRELLARENPNIPWYTASVARLQFCIGEALSESGQPVEALPSYKKSVEIQERLALEHPKMRAAIAAWIGRADMVTSNIRICDLLSKTGKKTEALKSLEEALAILEGLERAHPASKQQLERIAAGHTAIGDLLDRMGRKTEAHQSFGKALAVYAKLIATEPGKNQSDDALVALHDAMGSLSSRLGRAADALKSHLEALAIRERRAQAQPHNLRDRLALAIAQNYISNLYVATGQVGEAEACLRKSVDVLEGLTRDDPKSAEVVSVLGLTLHTLAGLDLRRDWLAAREELRQGIAHQKRATVLDVGNVGYRGHLRNQLMALGSHSLAHGAPAEASDALECYREAQRVSEWLVREQPNLPQHQLDLAAGHTTIGNLLEQTGRKTEALQSFENALATLNKLAGPQLGKPDYDDVRITTYDAMSKLLSNMGLRNDALESTRRSLMLRERRSQAYPDDHTYLGDLAGIYSRTGDLLEQAGKKAEAFQSFEKALTVNEKLVRLLPDNGQADDALVGIHDSTTTLLRRMGRLEDVLRSSQKALVIRQRRTRAHPENLVYQNDLAGSYNSLGDLLDELGKKAEALESFRKALAAQDRLSREQRDNFLFELGLAKLHARIGSLSEQSGRENEALQSFDKALEKYQGVVRLELAKAKSDAVRKPLHLYDAACFLSCCVPLGRRKGERDRFADEAMKTLRLAVAAGWGREEWAPLDPRSVGLSRAAWTARDPDLVPLHNRDDFQRLVAQLFDRDFPTDPFAP